MCKRMLCKIIIMIILVVPLSWLFLLEKCIGVISANINGIIPCISYMYIMYMITIKYQYMIAWIMMSFVMFVKAFGYHGY